MHEPVSPSADVAARDQFDIPSKTSQLVQVRESNNDALEALADQDTQAGVIGLLPGLDRATSNGSKDRSDSQGVVASSKWNNKLIPQVTERTHPGQQPQALPPQRRPEQQRQGSRVMKKNKKNEPDRPTQVTNDRRQVASASQILNALYNRSVSDELERDSLADALALAENDNQALREKLEVKADQGNTQAIKLEELRREENRLRTKLKKMDAKLKALVVDKEALFKEKTLIQRSHDSLAKDKQIVAASLKEAREALETTKAEHVLILKETKLLLNNASKDISDKNIALCKATIQFEGLMVQNEREKTRNDSIESLLADIMKNQQELYRGGELSFAALATEVRKIPETYQTLITKAGEADPEEDLSWKLQTCLDLLRELSSRTNGDNMSAFQNLESAVMSKIEELGTHVSESITSDKETFRLVYDELSIELRKFVKSHGNHEAFTEKAAVARVLEATLQERTAGNEKAYAEAQSRLAEYQIREEKFRLEIADLTVKLSAAKEPTESPLLQAQLLELQKNNKDLAERLEVALHNVKGLGEELISSETRLSEAQAVLQHNQILEETVESLKFDVDQQKQVLNQERTRDVEEIRKELCKASKDEKAKLNATHANALRKAQQLSEQKVKDMEAIITKLKVDLRDEVESAMALRSELAMHQMPDPASEQKLRDLEVAVQKAEEKIFARDAQIQTLEEAREADQQLLNDKAILQTRCNAFELQITEQKQLVMGICTSLNPDYQPAENLEDDLKALPLLMTKVRQQIQSTDQNQDQPMEQGSQVSLLDNVLFEGSQSSFPPSRTQSQNSVKEDRKSIHFLTNNSPKSALTRTHPSHHSVEQSHETERIVYSREISRTLTPHGIHSQGETLGEPDGQLGKSRLPSIKTPTRPSTTVSETEEDARPPRTPLGGESFDIFKSRPAPADMMSTPIIGNHVSTIQVSSPLGTAGTLREDLTATSSLKHKERSSKVIAHRGSPVGNFSQSQTTKKSEIQSSQKSESQIVKRSESQIRNPSMSASFKLASSQTIKESESHTSLKLSQNASQKISSVSNPQRKGILKRSTSTNPSTQETGPSSAVSINTGVKRRRTNELSQGLGPIIGSGSGSKSRHPRLSSMAPKKSARNGIFQKAA
ncbi:hypothetical protein MMC25_007269 [Agyrium rufum]|nr:hypothetical protein [Agyrium rufum]